jgi:hypothetical protein
MIKFYSRQSGCARRVRKNENADTFKFVSQIGLSICMVTFTNRVKPDATIFKSRCSRMVACYRFDKVEALPLNFVRFLRLAIRSPIIQRSPARRSRNDREPSDKKSGEMSRSFPHNFLAIAGQWQMRCRRISARVTRETTRNMARNARTAVRATDNATTSETSRKLARRNFVVTLSTMAPKKL